MLSVGRMEEVPLRVALHEGDFDLDEREYLLPPSDHDIRIDNYKPHHTKKQRGCINLIFCRLCQWIWRRCRRQRELKARNIVIGQVSPEKFPPNVIRNQKYNVITFLPLVLFQQFKFFLNLYFLIMATSQFIPDIRIGYLYTYWGPLVRWNV
ncbi:hypothetical protein J437_LFUL001084 [Ladona fulva]|uniref:P-type ATPase N-terminal domain-containing protein n=1 Tax=Ladona fulva TaxID=123851 RepID=A0A8K0JY04_LADFU|nr:hypothetical protein J437_LFUL001084 [Ladona fulva]